MHQLKQKILEIFKNAHHEKSPDAEANLILLHVFQRADRSYTSVSALILKNPEVTTEIEEEALRLAQERTKGKPLQHLLEHQFFLNHDYQVSESVLIPRPETEILASQILDRIQKMKGASSFRFAELGLGSGILSCEVLAKFLNAKGVASETSLQAIAVARGNLFSIIGRDWENRLQIIEPQDATVGFEVFKSFAPFDFVFSNPPYVSVNDEVEEEVFKHEPHLALFPSALANHENPNYFYESFLIHSKAILSPGGVAFFEIPHERADAIVHEFKNAGFTHAHLLPDLTGRSRVLETKRSS